MKPWIRRSLIGLAGATALLGAVSACSHGGHHRQAWHAMSDEDAVKLQAKFVERAAGKLDLDAAQKAKLDVLAGKMRENRNALGANPRAEFQSVIAGATFDRAKAQQLVQDKTGAVQAKSPEMIAAMADFFDSLKPQQQAKVREYMAKSRRHGWRG